MGQQEAARYGVELLQTGKQGRDLSRVLALLVVEQHVAAEVRVSAEDFIGAFAGNHDLVAGVAYGAAQKVFRHAMGVDAEGLGLQDRIGEVIGEIVLPDGDGVEIGPGLRGHLFGLVFLIVVSAIEGQSEGPNGIATMERREAEHGARIEAAAEIAADGDIGTQTKTNCFVKRVTKFGGVVCVRA